MTSAVFVCHYQEPLRSTIVPVCTWLQRQAAVKATVIGEQDCDERARELCERNAIPYRRRGQPRPPRTHGPRLAAARIETGIGKPARTGLVRWMRRTAGSVATVPLKISQLVAYLAQLRPDVLVLLDDRTYAACRWIRAAQWLRIPVITIQWAAVHKPETMIELRAALETSEVRTKWVQRAQRIVSHLHPHAAQWHQGQQVWYFRSEHLLGHVLWRAFPRHNPWSYGGGNSDVVAVMGPAWKERLVRGGVPENKIVVTGHPDQDRWLQIADNRSQRGRADMLRRLKLPANAVPVTLIAPALSLRGAMGARRGDSTREELVQNLADMAHTVCQLGTQFRPVIKVHPRDDLASLQDLPRMGECGAKLVQDIDTASLIAYSGAMTCQWSTTAMIGHALSVPVIICDPLESPSAQIWHGAPGLSLARSLEDLKSQLSNALTSSSAATAMAAQRRLFVERYMCLDGQATQRLGELILQFARSRSAAARPPAA